MEFFGEHPASMSEPEFWGYVRSFLSTFAEAQRRLQRDFQAGTLPPAQNYGKLCTFLPSQDIQ